MSKFHIIADASQSTDEFPLLNKSIMKYISHEIIALDGAAEILYKMNIVPQVIIGDLDTITPVTLEYFQNINVEIIKLDDQESTDLDKGINHALSLGATEIIISNAVGGRADHTIYNYRILKKYYDKLHNMKIITLRDCMQYFEDSVVKVTAQVDRPIAVLSFPKAVVKSSGLLYELDGIEVEIGGKESSSNKMIAETVTIDISGKGLVIYPLDARIDVTY